MDSEHRDYRETTELDVLMAIVAWAMLEWPWIVRTVDGEPPSANWTTYPAVAPEFRSTINPALLCPALSLAAFVGWKAAWAIVERMWRRAEAGKV